MIELSTPVELIKEMAVNIENERKYQKIKQKDLAFKANIPYPTFKEFIYKDKISFENLLKILIALDMYENIKGLLTKREPMSLEDIKNRDTLTKRVS
ncbi:MAG: hypothetical protein OIF32_09805 [Campylobacterales bacterium]|nr:hypothetical protein [Campylobacterales bacterium]